MRAPPGDNFLQLADLFSRKAIQPALYSPPMWKRLSENFPRREQLLWLVMLAVIAPIAVLLWLQYRALLDLRAQTRVVIEYNLRQTLQQLNNETEERLLALARATLDSLPDTNDESLVAWRWPEMRRGFDALRQAHPEINQIYCSNDLTPDGMDHYALWDGQAWRTRAVDGEADDDPALAAGSPETAWMAVLNASQGAQPRSGWRAIPSVPSRSTSKNIKPKNRMSRWICHHANSNCSNTSSNIAAKPSRAINC